ncbi:MAG: hypothetical protein ACLR0U_18770 [Enterocloster clostridioformis]
MKVFGPDDARKTLALSMTDGSDYVPMGTPPAYFLIQPLNIAGLGPIFGALAIGCPGPCGLFPVDYPSVALLARRRP